MAIGKPRGKNGMRPVFVYDPRIGRKVYVGSRKQLRGEDGAKALETAKTQEFAKQPSRPDALTIGAYVTEWLDLHHGPGTRRPAATTRTVNEGNLRAFVKEYGHRGLDDIDRREALQWAKQHPTAVKVVSAMFADAVDDMVCKTNQFANRRQQESRERKHIHPLTEAEADLLADIALRHWGQDGYGLTARAWVTFGAWVGCRPGETFTVGADDLDFANGEVTIRRVKRRGGIYPVDVVVLPDAAIDAIRRMPAVPAHGPLFTTVTGKPLDKGALRYYWDPIRSAFREKVTERRWQELLDDVGEQGERQRAKDLPFYSLRHMCASVMADRGASMADIAHQLGNSEQVCRETYVHSYVDRANDRNRALLNRQPVSDLDEARKRRGA